MHRDRTSPPAPSAPVQPSLDAIKKRIIASYDDWLVRAYCTVRFRIINLRILEELEQYVP
jgi:hypothetical protein